MALFNAKVMKIFKIIIKSAVKCTVWHVYIFLRKKYYKKCFILHFCLLVVDVGFGAKQEVVDREYGYNPYTFPGFRFFVDYCDLVMFAILRKFNSSDFS